MDKKLTRPHKMNKHTLQYKLLLITQQNTNTRYNYSEFLSVNIKSTSLYALIRIRY